MPARAPAVKPPPAPPARLPPVPKPGKSKPKPTPTPTADSTPAASASASASTSASKPAPKPLTLKAPAFGWDKEILKRTELSSLWDQGKLHKFNDWDKGVGPGIEREFALRVAFGKWVPGKLNRAARPGEEELIVIDDGGDESDGDPPAVKRARGPGAGAGVSAQVISLDLPDLPRMVRAAVDSAVGKVMLDYTPAAAQPPKPDSGAAYYAEIDARLAAQRVTVPAPDPLPHNTTLPIPRPYTGPILTEEQVQRKAAAISQPVRHKRTLVASNVAVPNLTVTVWDCPSLHPRLSCAVPDADPLAPAARALTPLAVKHLTFDSAGQPRGGPASRSSWRFRVEEEWFARRGLLELRLEGGRSVVEQAARGESWVRESVMRLERGMEHVYCLVKSGSLEWSVRAE